MSNSNISNGFASASEDGARAFGLMRNGREENIRIKFSNAPEPYPQLLVGFVNFV